MKVSELEGKALDAWVAKALGYKHLGAIGVVGERKGKLYCLSGGNDYWQRPDQEEYAICGPCEGFPYHYSTDWALGGPIVERERIGIHYGLTLTHAWVAVHGGPMSDQVQTGPTALISAMRAFVFAKFGEEVA